MGRKAALLIGLLASNGLLADEPPDPTRERKEKAQKDLDKRSTFNFPEHEKGLWHSVAESKDCKIHMIHDPKRPGEFTFQFERDDKVVVTIVGGSEATFRTKENVLYFAHFSWLSSGCKVTAHDLITGKKLWETRLMGIGSQKHSLYSNEVTLFVGKDTNGDGCVTITGRESNGDYVEVLDSKTGKLIAHKVYRDHFINPKKP